MRPTGTNLLNTALCSAVYSNFFSLFYFFLHSTRHLLTYCSNLLSMSAVCGSAFSTVFPRADSQQRLVLALSEMLFKKSFNLGLLYKI